MYQGISNDSDIDNTSTITKKDGLQSNYIRDFAISHNYCIYVTDQGLARQPFAVPLYSAGSAVPITGIDFIKDTEFLFVDTEFTLDFSFTSDFIVASANKVAVSSDDGIVWREMTPPELGDRTITCVAIDDSTLYVGTNDGLFVSHKNKDVWFHYTKIDGLEGSVIRGISVDVIKGKYLMVATDQGLSQGFCFKWSTLTISDVTQINCLVNIVDGSETTNIFYAGTDKGLYRSADGCQTWSNVYKNKAVLSLATTNITVTLYVGTDGDGIFIYKKCQKY